MEESIRVPSGILSTCYRQNRRSYDIRSERTTDRGERRAISLIVERPEDLVEQSSRELSTSRSQSKEVPFPGFNHSGGSHARELPAYDLERPQPAVVDFAQLPDKIGIEADTDRQAAGLTISSVPDVESTEEQDSPGRASAIFRRLSYIAQNVTGTRRDSRSGRSDRRSFRFSTLFRPSNDSHDSESFYGTEKRRKRESKLIPKSWRFLGIDNPGVAATVSDITNKLRNPNFRQMYEKAKVKQEKIKRSTTAQLIFRYTFYTLLLATVYLLLIGLPLWRGLVWYMYILFEKHLVLKAGLSITLGIGFL